MCQKHPVWREDGQIDIKVAYNVYNVCVVRTRVKSDDQPDINQVHNNQPVVWLLKQVREQEGKKSTVVMQ